MNPVENLFIWTHSKRKIIRSTFFNLRERCHSKPLLSVSEDDYGNSGSVLSVIDAMKLGHGIHVTINGFIQYLSSDNIEYSELEDEVVAMDIWQIVTGYATTHVRFTVSIFTVKFILV